MALDGLFLTKIKDELLGALGEIYGDENVVAK